MSKGRSFLFVVCFLIIDVLLVGSIFLIRDFTEKNKLKNEVNALVELDFSIDNYNSKIKSSGEYATIEKAIKKFLDNYASEVQNCLSIRYDKKLNNMLMVDNYVNDGPMFNDSLEYIDTLRNNFNYSVDLLMYRVSDEAINEYIYCYEVDDESIQLYNNLLLESNLIKKIEENQVRLAKKRIEINSYIDSIYNVLVFLKDNSNTYSIVNDKIIFNDMNIENEYYKLLRETKRIYE